MTLQELIDTLTFSNKIHISIVDMSGVLSSTLFVAPDNRIHSKEICTLAKLAPKGLRLCFSCKILSTKKALKTGGYTGECPYGITEAVKAVYYMEKPICIIYAGNLITDRDVFREKTKKCCRLTKGDYNEIISLAETAQTNADKKLLENICQILSDFISKEIAKSDNLKNVFDTHYAVSALVNYANEFYKSNITLKSMAKLYYLNENYLGRLFKKQMGISFSEYLNNLRINNACELLKNTNLSIIDIAYSCGFNNVTYFNRIFKGKKNVTPKEYRKVES